MKKSKKILTLGKSVHLQVFAGSESILKIFAPGNDSKNGLCVDTTSHSISSETNEKSVKNIISFNFFRLQSYKIFLKYRLMFLIS